jgi:hypothetical protein
LSHIYADNGVYKVKVTIGYDSDHSSSSEATVTVNNVPPTVYAGADATVPEGTTVTIPGHFTDPGVLDTWAATVDYGDGTPLQSLPLNPDKTFTLSHTYGDNPKNGPAYTITVTVTDKDGGMGSDTVDVTVTNVAPKATIDAIGQPNSHFILPLVHTLTL